MSAINSKNIDTTVRQVIEALIVGINNIDPQFFKGFYLTGSIPLNDYHVNKSDIDFLILCTELPNVEVRRKIEDVHEQIEAKFKKSKLSGFYVTTDALHVDRSKTTKTWSFHEGKLSETNFEMAAVTLFELKISGITILGIPAHQLPINCEVEDVHKFLHENINTYWKNWVTRHSGVGLHPLFLILFPVLTEWVILGVARQLFTLESGKITSKTAAGYYCLERLPYKHHAIIKEAIKIRNGKAGHLISIKGSYFLQPSIKRARETISCANYIIGFFNKKYKERCNESR